MQTNCICNLIVTICYNVLDVSTANNHVALMSSRSTVTSYNYIANGIEIKLS